MSGVEKADGDEVRELNQNLRGVRTDIKGVLDRLDARSVRTRRLAWVIGFTQLVLVLACIWVWRDDQSDDQDLRAETEAREMQRCFDTNENRDQLREALSEVLTRTILRVSQNPPSDQVIETYKRVILEDLNATFPPRDCGAEAEARADG